MQPLKVPQVRVSLGKNKIVVSQGKNYIAAVFTPSERDAVLPKFYPKAAFALWYRQYGESQRQARRDCLEGENKDIEKFFAIHNQHNVYERQLAEQVKLKTEALIARRENGGD